MGIRNIIIFFGAVFIMYILSITGSSCAQIGYPTGGKRDSIPPVLINATPAKNTVNFSGNRITLNFDEYILVDQLRENLLVSPTPKSDPFVNFKLKTVTIKLRDTLQANTTYRIDLGDAIRDNNERNILKDFSYVFSTGPTIDSLTLSGKVKMAETGKPDSTIIALLYKDLDDSAVYKEKPKYISKLDSLGNFTFYNLAPAVYHIYALKDGDGSKNYNSQSELFAFADSAIRLTDSVPAINLFAFQEEKEKPKAGKTTTAAEKKLTYSTRLKSDKQDIFSDIILEFNKPLKNFDSGKIILSDTLYNINNTASVTLDFTKKIVRIKNKWKADSSYDLVVLKEVGSDSTGLALAKSDTIRFKTRSEADYGSLKIHFTNFNKSKNPVLQFIKSTEVVKAYPLISENWSERLFDPGEYELRILFDTNGNGIWDTGNYIQKIQPEKVYSILQKLNIRANWENEREIQIGEP